MRNKYGAKKTIINGIEFDSIAESEYYLILLSKKQHGEIKDFGLQPKFELLPAFESQGKKHKPITYTADFRVEHLDGSLEIIDIKGFEPRDFPLRKKLFSYNNRNLVLTILADCPKKYMEHADDGPFIELDKLKKLRAAEKRKQSKEAANNDQAKKETKQAAERAAKSRARRHLRKRI